MEAPKTVKVRIAVAVDPSGDWNASGWRGCDDQTAMGNTLDTLNEGEARYWLEAELPIPQVTTVAAEVKSVEQPS